MDSSQDGFTPKKFWHMHVKEHTTGGFKNMPEFPFGKAILLWGIRARGFMDDAIGLKEGVEGGIDVVFGIIGAKATNRGRELGLDKGVEVGNNSGNFGFMF